MTDDEKASATDDAVTNHGDDTALDEGHGAHINGQELEEKPQQVPILEHVEQSVTHRIEEAQHESSEPSVESAAEELAASESELGEIADVESEVEPESAAIAPRGPIEETPEEPEDIHMDWFILKVQSNRERSIAEALARKMKIEGYERFFDQAIVPTEKVTEFKGGKKKVVERKLYPGYIVVHMHINDDTWFAVRETSGVGDFTGAGGKPTPMLPQEVARIVQTEEEETSEAPKLDIKFATGDKVKVKEGNFESFEGEVNTIDEASGRVTVMINIFGRSTPVELEYWQIEAV
jgi:transcription termination/antitermination protein NusG